jgi:quercetin dioxygenase-like cupin family protein
MATSGIHLVSDFVTPKLRRPGEGKTLNVLGDRVTIKVSSAETGGTCAVIEDVCPPQGGPPLHIHQWEDEAFYILEGEYEFRLGDRRMRAGKGAFAFLPRGVAHTFKNVGTTPGRHLTTIVPGGFERFFERIDQISKAGPTDFDAVLALADSFGLIFVGPKD